MGIARRRSAVGNPRGCSGSAPTSLPTISSLHSAVVMPSCISRGRFSRTGIRTRSWRTNVIGTERVLDAAVRAGVRRVVHASSIGAYSPAPDGMVVDENWPTNGIPQLGYSWQKAYVERLLDAFEARTDVAVDTSATRAHLPARRRARDSAPLYRPARADRPRPNLDADRHPCDPDQFPGRALAGRRRGRTRWPPSGTNPVHSTSRPSRRSGGRAPIGRLEPALHDAAALVWRLAPSRPSRAGSDLALRAPLMDTHARARGARLEAAALGRRCVRANCSTASGPTPASRRHRSRTDAAAAGAPE